MDIFTKKEQMWESLWSEQGFDPHWAGKGVAPEVLFGLEKGWLPTSGRVLDIGCGDGLMANWFSQKAYQVSAFDIAESAIAICKKNAQALQNPPDFFTLDICQQAIPGGPYDIILDRGCLHQIPGPGMKHYVRHVSEAASDNARFLLICAAYRDGNPVGDPQEKQRHVRWMKKTFAGEFRLVAATDTFLDKWQGQKPAEARGGIAFWLERIPPKAA